MQHYLLVLRWDSTMDHWPAADVKVAKVWPRVTEAVDLDG